MSSGLPRAYGYIFLLPLFVSGSRIDSTLVSEALDASESADSKNHTLAEIKEHDSGLAEIEEHDSGLAEIKEHDSGHVYTNCYCWDNPTDPSTQRQTKVDSWLRAVGQEQHQRCLEKCGPSCVRQIGGVLAAKYKFTCGDNPATRRCGIWVPSGSVGSGRLVLPATDVGCKGESSADVEAAASSVQAVPSSVKPVPSRPAAVPSFPSYDPSSAAVVAILADYDGCWQMLSGTNPGGGPTFMRLRREGKVTEEHDLEFVTRWLKMSLNAITSGKSGEQIALLVGSNRQSVELDQINRDNNNNGLALGEGGAFELWQKDGVEGVPALKGCNLEKVLLADGKVDGSAWTDSSKEFDWSGGDEKIKLDLAHNAIRRLGEKYGDKPIDIFFYDDKIKYIQHVLKYVKLPSNMRFFYVHYRWTDFALGKDQDDAGLLRYGGVLRAVGRTETFLLQ